jgi:hypothetical protein
MKRRDLTGKIAAAAKGLIIPIPRHSEIRERTAEDIMKECEPKLGNRWLK